MKDVNNLKRKEVVLSTEYGDVNGDLKLEKVTLIGYSLEENGTFISKLDLIIEGEGIKDRFRIDEEGYGFKLFLINTNNDKIDKILITGDYGGSGGFAIADLYKYKDNKIKLIFNNKIFNQKYKYEAIFLKNYKVEVKSTETDKKYIIDISDKDKEYLSLIYDKDGNILPYANPEVSYMNAIYPIQLSFNDYYSFLVYQRIIGVTNADTLGWIQTTIDISDEGNIKTIYQYLLLYGEDIKIK